MNDRLADALDAFTTICITAIEKAKQWREIADERSAEIIRLNARVAELEAELNVMHPVVDGALAERERAERSIGEYRSIELTQEFKAILAIYEAMKPK
jgi:outer membrane murein-binding lipoprotein Lpp